MLQVNALLLGLRLVNFLQAYPYSHEASRFIKIFKDFESELSSVLDCLLSNFLQNYLSN